MRGPIGSNDRFYTELPHFEEFDQVSDPALFHPVPDDWHVVISDIRNSTIAIAEGRYKHVNMAGAACITAVTNALKATGGADSQIPYVFGGDGATFLVPTSELEVTKRALLGTAVMAAREFDFILRVGAVSVRELRAAGLDVTVAKLRLGPRNELAMLGGGGIKAADRMIKADTDGSNGHRVDASGDEAEPDMTGLSCRWEPLKASHGVMLCIMVLALPDEAGQRRACYDQVLQGVESVLGGDLKSASPVTARTMVFKWIPKGLRMEAQITRGNKPAWRRLAYLLYQSLIQYFLEKYNKSAGGYDAPRYRDELRANSDYRRFDDTLRLVLDCSQEQVTAIEDLLKSLRQNRKIAYGLHTSEHALMTCLVFNLNQGDHVHFVDGGIGGFTQASIEFKRQLGEV